jgi:hypothetical protein
LSFVILTVYVPGNSLGPIVAPPAMLAALGTVGGGNRIDHVTLLKPRRFVVGIVLTTFPVESSTSIFMSPKM